MPPLPVIPLVYRVAFNWKELNTGGTAANVMHFKRNTGDEDDVFNDIDAHVSAALWEPVNSGAFVETVEITALDGLSATRTFNTGGSTTAKWQGGTSGGPEPAVAALVKLETDLRGRSRHGRIYLPFVSENGCQNGQITSGTFAVWQGTWNAFRLAVTALGSIMHVASYKLGDSTVVTNCLEEQMVGTQRRRQSRLRA